MDRLSESEGVITTAKPKEAIGGVQGQRNRLPIAKQRDKLLYMVQKYPVVVVVGQTGCGKTTRESTFNSFLHLSDVGKLK